MHKTQKDSQERITREMQKESLERIARTSPQSMQRPGVGVGVFILRKDSLPYTFLLGLRKGSHGAGTWSLPGGHIEMYDDEITTAIREVKEETGLYLGAPRLAGVYTNDPMPQWGKHYITVYVKASFIENGDEPRILEPDKCAEWRWCSLNRLPSPLFPPIENLLKTGYSPWREPIV